MAHLFIDRLAAFSCEVLVHIFFPFKKIGRLFVIDLSAFFIYFGSEFFVRMYCMFSPHSVVCLFSSFFLINYFIFLFLIK